MTIKLAFKKDNPNLVFDIKKIERVNIADGIVEYYSGELIDTSTVPDTRKEFKAQVMAFESEWVDVPVDLGSTGDINNQNKTATPSTSAQTIKPDTGYTGLNKVDIAAVDASIDANIVAGNIKKDVEILGVTGTLKSGNAKMTDPGNIVLSYGQHDVCLSEVLTKLDAPIVISTDSNNFYFNLNKTFLNFKGNTINLTGSNFSNCIGYTRTFQGCTNLTALIGTLANSSSTNLDLEGTFINCSSLTNLNLRNLDNAGSINVKLFLTFYGCTSLQHLDIGGLDLTRASSLDNYTFGEGRSYVPLDCEIIVKDDDSKTALLTAQPNFTNVKTVAEYEA